MIPIIEAEKRGHGMSSAPVVVLRKRWFVTVSQAKDFALDCLYQDYLYRDNYEYQTSTNAILDAFPLETMAKRRLQR